MNSHSLTSLARLKLKYQKILNELPPEKRSQFIQEARQRLEQRIRQSAENKRNRRLAMESMAPPTSSCQYRTLTPQERTDLMMKDIRDLIQGGMVEQARADYEFISTILRRDGFHKIPPFPA